MQAPPPPPPPPPNFFSMNTLKNILFQRVKDVEKKTTKLEKPLVSQETLKQYPSIIKQLYQSIFYDQKSFQQVLPFKPKKSQMPICNKLLSVSEQVYRCYDCLTHQAAVLCKGCFEISKHKSHRYTIISAGGGNCDCGNYQAIKPSGFCKLHPGKAEIVDIQRKQLQLFVLYMNHLFDWLFLLQTSNSPNVTIYGVKLIKYLKQLNNESLYYNTLTYHLFKLKIKQKQTCLTSLFKFGQALVNRQICSLIFEMFSLQQFKYFLTIQFIRSFNTVDNFQKSEYRNLYIQLLANNDLFLKVMQNQKMIIAPFARKYNEHQIFEDIVFITSIRKDVSNLYFKLLFNNHFINAIFFQELSEKLKQKNEFDNEQWQSIIVTYINKQIETQNSYSNLFKRIYDSLQERQVKQIIVRKLYSRCIDSQIYKKIKIILPYHRAFIGGILNYFENELRNITAKEICRVLNITQEQLFKFIDIATIDIFCCFWEYCTVLFRISYFDNYSPLYVKSGQMVQQYDFLFIKIIALLLLDLHEEKQFIRLVKKFLEMKKKQNVLNKQQKIQFNNRFIHFFSTLIEACLSEKAEICLADDKFKSTPSYQKRCKKLLSELLQIKGQAPVPVVQNFCRYFLGYGFSLNQFQDLIRYDSNSKKFTLKETNSRQKINMCYFPSVSKIRNALSQFTDHMIPDTIFLQQPQKSIINMVLSEQTINFFLQLETQLDTDKQKSKYFQQLSKMYFLIEKKGYLHKYFKESYLKNKKIFDAKQFKRIKQEVNVQSNTNEMSQQFKKKIKEIRQKKVQELRKKQIMSKKNFIKSQQEENEEDFNKICMVCREGEKQGQLGYVSYLVRSNLFERLFQIEQPRASLAISSCKHLLHFSCYEKNYLKNIKFECPFCKTYSNCLILAPVPKQSVNEQFLQEFHKYYNYKMKELLGGYRSISQQLFKTLTIEIASKILHNLNKFIHNEVDLLNSVYSVLKQILKQQKQKEQFFKIILQDNTSFNPKNIGQCCLSMIKRLIIADLTSEIIQDKQIFQKYQQFDKEILIKILQRTRKVINPNYQIEQVGCQQKQSMLISTIKEKYGPPQNIRQLLQKRDQIDSTCTKNGHQFSQCLLCGIKACIDCQENVKHSKQNHQQRAIFLSLIDGSVRLLSGKHSILAESLYQNKMGIKWKASYEPTGFMLNTNQYENMINLLVENKLEDFIYKRVKNGMELNFLNFVWNPDGDDSD